MRVLVAGRNAKVLAIAASTFATDLKIETATTKAEALALLARFEFDLILACERLGDGSGLEVLSQVAINTPNTLRIFAARPATLDLLKGELGLFGLFRTLSYPINFRMLWAALNLARSCSVESDVPPLASPRPAANAPVPARPKIQHVVLDNAWQAASGVTAAAPAIPPAPKPVAPLAASNRPPPPARQQPPARIPESEAFKRALARRNAARLEAGPPISPGNPNARRGKPAATKRRREPALSSVSLPELASMTAAKRPVNNLRAVPVAPGPRRRRTALFVGSGVFAAAAAVLSFFMLGSNNTIARSPAPLVASMDRPGTDLDRVLPWQKPPPDPPQQAAPVEPEVGAPAAADLAAQAEADSDASAIEPGHPGPPPPMAPPPPSEPPAVDWTGQPPEE